MERQCNRSTGLLLAGVLVVPVVLVSLYLGLSRWPTRWFTGASDIIAVALALVVGLECLWRLPISATARVISTLVYVPVATFGLVLYSLFFVGVVFGDWL